MLHWVCFCNPSAPIHMHLYIHPREAFLNALTQCTNYSKSVYITLHRYCCWRSTGELASLPLLPVLTLPPSSQHQPAQPFHLESSPEDSKPPSLTSSLPNTPKWAVFSSPNLDQWFCFIHWLCHYTMLVFEDQYLSFFTRHPMWKHHVMDVYWVQLKEWVPDKWFLNNTL